MVRRVTAGVQLQMEFLSAEALSYTCDLTALVVNMSERLCWLMCPVSGHRKVLSQNAVQMDETSCQTVAIRKLMLSPTSLSGRVRSRLMSPPLRPPCLILSTTTPLLHPSLTFLTVYFKRLDADANAVLSDREARPVHLVLRRMLRPHRCAKTFLQFCDHNLSALEFSSFLGV
ncbi:putative SPARC-related modular calcium-binding protein 1-like [Triplophysa rosa]|uniref:SPARC-related modular calcium-binding protein 1-like n=1 Tax=Triplophysa rosa TaxID=992332 RepID=A0A9W7W8I5_TRIRA|nr:putative SPARC-related modular calcium-binding protein 1-like [Triplophysa rosa]